MKRQTVVYVACPMTQGGFVANYQKCIDIAEDLKRKGYSPIVPVLTWFWGMRYNDSHEGWLKYDFGLIAVSDCLLRIPGNSKGADLEVDYAQEIGKDTYESLGELYHDEEPTRDILVYKVREGGLGQE